MLESSKIIHVKVHEAVNFEKALVTYFSTIGGPGRTAAKMTLLKDIQCILVEGPKDRAIVPLVNIAYIKIESDLSKEKEEKKKAELEKRKRFQSRQLSVPHNK